MQRYIEGLAALRLWSTLSPTPHFAMTDSERQPLLRNDTDGTQARQIPPHEVTQRAQEHPDYPIDHGYVAWVQVVGGFIIFANSW